MNERIQEMVYKLNNQVGIQWTNEDKLKFAELIVSECADIATMNQHQWGAVGDYVLKHFGIEE